MISELQIFLRRFTVPDATVNAPIGRKSDIIDPHFLIDYVREKSAVADYASSADIDDRIFPTQPKRLVFGRGKYIARFRARQLHAVIYAT